MKAALIKRKNYCLDENKIKKAQKILSAKTETETIHKALDLIVFQKEILKSLDLVQGKGSSSFADPERI